MSHNKSHSSKPSVGGFRLSSSFNQLYVQRKEQTDEFIKDISEKNGQLFSKEKSLEKNSKRSMSGNSGSQGSLFKLNAHSQALVDEVPIQILRKKSKSRLQSLQDNNDDRNKGKFRMLQNESQRKQALIKDRQKLLKKYNIDINSVTNQQNTVPKLLNNNIQNAIQEEDPEGTVKPSQLYSVNTKRSDPFVIPTIFQTPLLPCFASQFSPNPQFASSKTIRQGQGVWRIGKIKIRKNRAQIKIGQIQFQSELINGEGKCIGIKQNFMYKLKNWNGIWVSQPKQQND